jgi:hypothetical protein
MGRGKNNRRDRESDRERDSPVLVWLSCLGPFLVVLSRLFCSGCPFLTSLFFSSQPIVVFISWLSCPSWFSCSGCHILVVLSWRSCPGIPVWQPSPGSPIIAVLSWRSCHGCPILTLLSCLSCPG